MFETFCSSPAVSQETGVAIGSAGGLSKNHFLPTTTSCSQFEETLMQNMMNKLDFNAPLLRGNVSLLAPITVAGLR